MELSSSKFSLRSLVCSQLPLTVKNFSANAVVANSIKIWTQFRKSLGLHRGSDFSPTLNNHLFLPSCTDLTFRSWHSKGITTFKDLYDHGTFMSFTDLSEKYDLPRSHLFRFFQIRHFIQNQNPIFPSRPPETLIDSLLSLNPERKRLISSIFSLIDDAVGTPATHPKDAWERELGTVLSDDFWEQVLELVHSSSICARHGLIQCKIVHRVHYTNLRLSRIYANVSDSCNRCNQSPADHTHMFWSCPRLATFWSEIFNTLNTAYGTAISPDPLLALFGTTLQPFTCKAMQQVFAFTTLLARRLILLRWKHVKPPSHGAWLKELILSISLEKLRFSLKGSLVTFEKTWRPILDHLNSLAALPDDDD